MEGEANGTSHCSSDNFSNSNDISHGKKGHCDNEVEEKKEEVTKKEEMGMQRKKEEQENGLQRMEDGEMDVGLPFVD